MYKIILVTFFALAVAQPEVPQNENYITLNNYQYQRAIDDFDTKLTHFDELYTGRIEAAVEQSKLVSDALIRNNDRLNSLVNLGGDYKRCISKYRSALPNLTDIEKAISTCELAATNLLTEVLTRPTQNRNVLNVYYRVSYKSNLDGCDHQHDKTTTNYTACIIYATALANAKFLDSQKQFSAQLDAAACTAKAKIKDLFHCTFTTQSDVLSAISNANFLIQNCVEGKDECTPCQEYTCSEKYNLQVNTSAETIKNPFLGLENHKDCLMLTGYKNHSFMN